jgi:NAD(P)-dependent dehydrogenase (short-subunit alcohol dehydrogenase family)
MGRLDRMVTIVGLGVFKSALEFTLEDWQLDHDRNLRHVFFIAQQFARTVIADGVPGGIVCIASMAGVRAANGNVGYGAAKAGVVNLVKTMAVEWADYGIRANVVVPGSIVTPRFPASPGESQAMGHIVPLKRRGTVDEIARAVLFLASDLSTYTTGHGLAVEGGWLAATGYRSFHTDPQA